MNRGRLALFNQNRAACKAWKKKNNQKKKTTTKKTKCRANHKKAYFTEWVVNQEVIQTKTFRAFKTISNLFVERALLWERKLGG